MSLKEKLEATHAATVARASADNLAIIQRANDDLRASGILKKVVAVGQMAPVFTAQNYDGRIVSSGKLLEGGPLVVSFFRGSW